MLRNVQTVFCKFLIIPLAYIFVKKLMLFVVCHTVFCQSFDRGVDKKYNLVCTVFDAFFHHINGICITRPVILTLCHLKAFCRTRRLTVNTLT